MTNKPELPSTFKTCVLLHMILHATRELQKEIAKPCGDASWTNPRLIWKYQIEWDPDTQRPLPLPIDEIDPERRVLRETQAAMEFETLMWATRSAGRIYAAGVQTDLIPECLKGKSTTMTEYEREQFLRDLYMPFTAGISISGAGGSDRDGLLFKIPREGGIEYVELIFQIGHYWYVEDQGNSFFPLFIGLYPVDRSGSTVVVKESRLDLTTAEGEHLWDHIFERLNRYYTSAHEESLRKTSAKTQKIKQPFLGVLPDAAKICLGSLERFQAASASHGRLGHSRLLKDFDQDAEMFSEELYGAKGEAAWRTLGGILKGDIRTLRESSQAMGKLMIKLVERDGGFFRRSNQNALPSLLAYHWLIKLGDGRYLGFSMSTSESLERLEPALGRRGEQLLWLLHAEVWSQQRNLVIIPDVTIGQVFWGGDQDLWPRNWQQDIKRVLHTLQRLEFRNWIVHEDGRLNYNGPCWNAVSGYEPPSSLGVRDECLDPCPLHGSSVSHRHYTIRLADTFVGVLRAFEVTQKARASIPQVSTKNAKEILYDWNLKLSSDQKKGFRGEKSYASTDAFIGVLLGSSWCGFSSQQTRLLNTLFLELSHEILPKSKRGEPSRVPMKFNRTIPIRIAKRKHLPCPLLTDVQYVCFAGGGNRPGGSYTLGGTKKPSLTGAPAQFRKGWLKKAGYLDQDQVSRQIVRDFLNDLKVVLNHMGGIAVGYHHQRWLTMPEIELLASGNQWREALSVNIRPFVPTDYMARLEAIAQTKGGFSSIPRSREDLHKAISATTEAEGGITVEDLRNKITCSDRSQKEWAKEFGCSENFISMILNGKKKLPDDLARRIRKGWLLEKN
ncbi:hypothetical protein WDW86_15800 [Bdellovibrionota bacterium FG-2]